MYQYNNVSNCDYREKIGQLEDNSVDMILTDIPYCVSKKTNYTNIKKYTSKVGETKYKGKEFGTWDKGFDIHNYIEECCRILKPSKSIIVWCSWQQLIIVDKCIEESFTKLKKEPRIGVWKKTNPHPGNCKKLPVGSFEFFIWNRKGENCTFHNQNEEHYNKKGDKTRGIESLYFQTACVRGGHSTAKPVEIQKKLILTFTEENELVFDGLMGGGSTALAAIETNRKYSGFEKEKENCDLMFEKGINVIFSV
jgi:site-specific DNA-methyltransferase (adenine-specific)